LILLPTFLKPPVLRHCLTSIMKDKPASTWNFQNSPRTARMLYYVTLNCNKILTQAYQTTFTKSAKPPWQS